MDCVLSYDCGMSARRIVHTITPGDHFSPRTGSAIPTVVDGLAAAAAASGDPRHAVVVDASTMHPRYTSAEVIEYTGTAGPSRWARRADVARGILGLPRTAAAGYFQPIADALTRLPPSLVIAHNAPLLPWLLRSTSHRVVLYAHNEVLRTYTRADAQRVLGDVAAIVCVSESLAERTRERLPRSIASRVHAVGNAVDTQRFSPGAEPAAGADRPMQVMFVGRMVREKGVDVLLRAASAFRADEIEVVLVGSQGFDASAELSPYERELRVLAEGIPVRVSFRPFVDRLALPGLLRSADVLVVPSRWAEPSGLTIGEGLASGLPVVASRVGGIPEVLGTAGMLVEPEDPADLAAALRRLIADPGLRESLRVVARERAEAHDWAWAWGILRGILDGGD